MRIVSLLASGTEIVCGLGAGDALVGRSHECDNPPWVKALPVCTRPAFDVNQSSGRIDAEVRRRINAGEPLYHIDTELIRSLRPDLLITQSHCQVCAVTPGDVQGADAGIVAAHVLALSAGNVQGIFDGITSVAQALDIPSAGAHLIAGMRRRMEAVTDSVRYLPTPTVVLLEWTDPIFSMGNWAPELVEAANGRALLGDKGHHSQAIPWDRVREADPDYLIIAPCGFDLERTMKEVPLLESLDGWADLKAVRSGHVALADGNRFFNRSGTTIVETVEMIAAILHGGERETPHPCWKAYAGAGKTDKLICVITKADINAHREAILAIARRNGASDVRIFGSVARGDVGEVSDLDLVVRFDPDRSLMDYGMLIEELQELLGVKVDVVSEAALEPRDRFSDRVGLEAVPL